VIGLRRYPILLPVKSGRGRSGLVDHEHGICTRSLILEKINDFKGLATPTGFEKAPNTTKDHVDSPSPTENALPPESKKRFTKDDGSKVAKLAILAGNAVRNVDLHRALDLIEEIRAVGEGCGRESLPGSIRVLR
jgi:hypothetical protein